MDQNPRTARVRIAVAVDASGCWYGKGWGHADESAELRRRKGLVAMADAAGEVDDGANCVFLTADVRFPDPERPIPEIGAMIEEVSGG